MNWSQALTAIDRMRDCAEHAQNPWFKEYWLKTAEELGQKYLTGPWPWHSEQVGQPWLRTYDGKLN